MILESSLTLYVPFSSRVGPNTEEKDRCRRLLLLENRTFNPNAKCMGANAHFSIDGFAVGVVLRSENEQVKKGDHVYGWLGMFYRRFTESIPNDVTSARISRICRQAWAVSWGTWSQEDRKQGRTSLVNFPRCPWNARCVSSRTGWFQASRSSRKNSVCGMEGVFSCEESMSRLIITFSRLNELYLQGETVFVTAGAGEALE